MKFLRTVDADAYQETVFLEEPAPLGGEQSAVGLYAVVDVATTCIDALQLKCLLVEGDGSH